MGSNPPTSLVSRTIQQVSPPLTDHRPLLAEYASRMTAQRERLRVAWMQTLTQTSAPHASFLLSQDAVDTALAALVDSLNAPGKLDIEAYLQGITHWGERMILSGADQSDLYELLQAGRRAALPLLVDAFPTGPELQAVLAALDSLYQSVLLITAAAAVQVMQEQLMEGARQRAVGHLTGGVAHTLNNLLAAIIGRAQLLVDRMTDDQVLFELRAIQTTARAGAENLRRVQEYAAPRQPASAGPLDVNTLISEAVQLTRFRWRDDAEASGIIIDLVQDLAPVPPVLAEAALLRDALIELILNAVEAMPLGGVITVRTERAGEQVKISVTDIGEGMDPATQQRLFEPFFTTKGFGHMGLGLVSARAIAVRQGGALTLASGRGQGTTAAITLPIAPEAARTAPAPPPQAPRLGSILIVDDEPALREIVQKAFALRGYQAAVAESGFEALRVFAEHGPFDIVLTDLGMPGMNGFEVAREIKKLNPRTIVILITGWAADIDPKRMRETGIDRAVTKPFEIDQVLKLLGEAASFRRQL